MLHSPKTTDVHFIWKLSHSKKKSQFTFDSHFWHALQFKEKNKQIKMLSPYDSEDFFFVHFSQSTYSFVRNVNKIIIILVLECVRLNNLFIYQKKKKKKIRIKSTCVCIFFLNIELKQFCNIFYYLLLMECYYLLISICLILCVWCVWCVEIRCKGRFSRWCQFKW